MTYGEQVTPGVGGTCVCMGPASHYYISLGACGAWLLYFQDASTLLLGNKRVAQPIRVTFEREQVGCRETGPAKLA